MIDGGIERLGRGLAARTTRRTFLDRAAKLAVLVAGGPTLATLLAERAEARVCGQSGVSPKCPTFDCTYPDSVWGWCWYASPGCCAGGGLKKICDCCTLGWPNVHGYCPSGTNVRCIVESCANDPRVMHVPIQRASGFDAAAVAASRSRMRPAGQTDTVVLGDAQNPLAAGIAAPVATVTGGSLLLTPRTHLPPGIPAEIKRLGAARVLVVGPVPNAVRDQLAGDGIEVTHIGSEPTIEAISVSVARWILDQTGGRRAVCVTASGVSAAAAPFAATYAAQARQPLLVGTAAATAFTDDGTIVATLLVGPEASAIAGQLSGGFPTRSTTPDGLAIELASITVDALGARSVTVHLVPAGPPHVAHGLAGTGGVLLRHPNGALGSAVQQWLIGHQPYLGRAVLGGSFGTLGDAGLLALQSALHRFDTHRLQGVSGQGLPVISQPSAERPLGRARIQGLPEAQPSSYWSGRANPKKR